MTWAYRAMTYPGDPSDNFFTNATSGTKPQINRNYGRNFFGDAAGHNGASDGNVVGGSWLQGFNVPAVATEIDDWDYFEDTARTASITTGGIGMSGVARPSLALDAIGATAIAVNYGSAGKNAWGLYADGFVGEAGARYTHGGEINIGNGVGPSPRGGGTPYDVFQDGMAVGLAMASGCDASVFGRTYWTDVGIEFRDNGSPFSTGINFRFDSIVREGSTDDKTSVGNSGYARAISMASEQGISWYSQAAIVKAAPDITSGGTYIIQTVGTTDFTLIGAASNNVGVAFVAWGPGTGTGTASLAGSQDEVARVWSEVTSPDIRWRAWFDDTAFRVGEGVSPQANFLIVEYNDAAESGVGIVPGPVGVGPTVQPRGTPANINLHLEGKGTGGVKVEVSEFANNAAAAAALSVGVLYYRTGHGLDIVR